MEIEVRKLKKGYTVFKDSKETEIGCEKCIYFDSEKEECEKEEEFFKGKKPKYGLFCGAVCGDFKIA